MKRPKLSAMDYANTIIDMERKQDEMEYSLAVYKRALSEACHELSLSYTNEKADEDYWLIDAIEYFSKLQAQEVEE